MQLVKTVRKGQDIVGVVLDLGAGETLAAALEVLHTKEVFDGLINDGWRYIGHPYEFTKQGVRLQDFPDTIEFSSLVKEDQYDFHAVSEDRYTGEELVERLAKEVDVGIPWEKPLMVSIHTRDELRRFLQSTQYAIPNVNNPMSYMPLNSFCAPEALLDVAEYMNPANKSMVASIERRRSISLACYAELVKVFQNQGMKEDFDYFDFLKFYMSWGICGINDRLLEVKRMHLNCPMRHLDNAATNPFFNEIPAVINREGIITPKPKPGQVFQKYMNRENNRAYVDKLIASLGPGEVYPIVLKEAGTEEVLSYSMLGGQVMFNTIEQAVSILGSTYVKYYKTIQVNLPAGSEPLKPEFYNINSEAIVEKIYNYSWISALVKYTCERLRVNSDATSVRALQITGMNIPNAVMFVMVSGLQEHLREDDSGNTYKGIELEERVFMEKNRLLGIRDFALGRIHEEDDPKRFLDMADTFEACIRGETLIDDLAMTSVLDSRMESSEIFKAYEVAVNNLGIQPREILSLVTEAIANKKDKLELHSLQGQYVSVPLIRADNQYKQFSIAQLKYSMRACAEAETWVHITEMYTEPKQQGRAKHAAVRYLAFKHLQVSGRGKTTTRYPDIYFALQEAVDYNIYNLSDEKRNEEKKMREAHICHTLFEIATKGAEARFPQELGGGLVNPLPNLVSRIRECCVERIETCAALCDSITDTSGRFAFYFDNVIMTPELCVPRRNANPIQERPFYLMCIDVTKDLKPADAIRWANLGYTRHPEYRGLVYEYPNMYGVGTHVEASGLGEYEDRIRVLRMSPYSLVYHFKYLCKYVEEKHAEGYCLLDGAMSCAQHAYGEYVSPAPEGETKVDTKINNFEMKAPQKVSQEDILTDFPEVIDIFNAHIIEHDPGATYKGVPVFHSFYGFTAEDLVFLPKDIVFNIDKVFENKIPVEYVSGPLAVFADQTSIDVSDVNLADYDKYAIYQFQNTVLVATKDGTIYRRG